MTQILTWFISSVNVSSWLATWKSLPQLVLEVPSQIQSKKKTEVECITLTTAAFQLGDLVLDTFYGATVNVSCHTCAPTALTRRMIGVESWCCVFIRALWTRVRLRRVSALVRNTLKCVEAVLCVCLFPCVTVLLSLQTLSPHLRVFGVFLFSVLHQSYAHEKMNKSGRWCGWVSPLCSAPRSDDWGQCLRLRPTGFLFIFIFFCTSFFDAPFIRARIHSSFKPALKSFFCCCCYSKSLCKQRGWNNSYGNRDAFGCNTAGCSPSAILPLCSKEFPEHAAGERDTLPARCLIPLASSCAFSLFVCRAAVLFYIFFSNITLLQLFFSALFPNFWTTPSFLLCTARISFLFFPSFFPFALKNRS